MRTDGIWGFYPLVGRADRVRWLLGLGARTIQLRCKDLAGDALRREVSESLEYAEAAGAQLVVNDHHELARELGARWVHLGQRDLDQTTPASLEGLEVGISTHSPGERARAVDWGAAYIALGPVWQTTLKRMPWAPQGLDRVAAWRRAIDVPLVAIGGITLQRAPLALRAGADAIALVSDITGPDADQRVEAWLELFSARPARPATEAP